MCFVTYDTHIFLAIYFQIHEKDKPKILHVILLYIYLFFDNMKEITDHARFFLSYSRQK